MTGFYMDYTNLQVRQILSGFAQTTNAGKATIYGLELEGAAILGGGFTLFVPSELLHATYDKFLESGVDRRATG